MNQTDNAMVVRDLVFVVAVSRWEVFHDCLLRSPCLAQGHYPVIAQWGASSAAEIFNAAVSGYPHARWIVWVHQDVVLPSDWDKGFLAAINEAEARFAQLAVVGVYGVHTTPNGFARAGHVLDRGQDLKEQTPLPASAHSLDEMLFAVRGGSGLTLDPLLKFDFYATDIVLQAHDRGLSCAIVDAHCEHRSDTPRTGPFPDSSRLCSRIAASGIVFENKWRHRLPVQTPLLLISKAGDVARFVNQYSAAAGI